jgi:hypothetical protein
MRSKTTNSSRKRSGARVVVPRPQRVRRIGESGFGWLDARLHHHGWLEVLSPEALATYSFLCLAADRNGVSWYRRDRIARTLGMNEQRGRAALRRLYELDLVAYQPFRPQASDGFHQVLSVPADGPPPAEDLLVAPAVEHAWDG